MSQKLEKQLAAKEAIKYVKNGMTIGLGTGSTAYYMLKELEQLVLNGLEIIGVPSSENTKKLAIEMGIPLTTLDKIDRMDIYIDGTDEFDPYMQLIKGGGGALLREKVLAHNSNLVIIIADSTKEVRRLGEFKLPIETIPFATANIGRLLNKMNLHPIVRLKDGKNYITDEGNYILDLNILNVSNLSVLEGELKQIPGIVETGLFLDMAHKIIVGKGDKTVTLSR
ncbi:ribose-5-phosphate isomerase RpiA [Arenibacter aquaticus]|uniref:Ribose-5-phosphate isomerase A n=1 Tax=Arenibacter aquaticus TaxID=2489054 RepID=A0A430K1V8_9FLAO|nr:ribose-5-phosphate isomerase RpiA [Arenibacter aquaticus]RTE53093.1 ribose-5-phosphate isomerase RpiA [Arenibacter aquaticus]